MRQQLRTGEVDLCFASQPLEDRSLHATDLVREEVLLAVPPDHHLAGSDRVAIDALADEPFVTTRRGHWQRTLTDHLFAQAGLQPTIVCEGDEPAASQDLISAGLGIGLLPAIAQRTAIHAPVAWLHLDAPACHRTQPRLASRHLPLARRTTPTRRGNRLVCPTPQQRVTPAHRQRHRRSRLPKAS